MWVLCYPKHHSIEFVEVEFSISVLICFVEATNPGCCLPVRAALEGLPKLLDAYLPVAVCIKQLESRSDLILLEKVLKTYHNDYEL